MPEEEVALQEPRHGLLRDEAEVPQGLQRVGKMVVHQLLLAPAPHELEHLGKELDLPDASGSELDVVLEAAAPDLGLDHGLHLPEGVNRAVVKVDAVDERAEHLLELGRILVMRPEHAGLHHGVALPAPAVLLVVVLHRGEAHREIAGLAERAEPHVDAEDHAVSGEVLQGRDEALPQPDEEGLVGDLAARPRGCSVPREAEDKVNVRGEVELVPAELSHAHHEHRLRVALLVLRGAELLAEIPVEPVAGADYGLLCDRGELAEVLLHV